MRIKNTIVLASVLILALTLVQACKKDNSGKKEKKPEYTTLADLLSKCSSASAEFQIDVKDVVVTAVLGNYAQLEDETLGAQLNKKDHGLVAGQKITGRISCKARATSGALILSLLDVSKANVTTVAEIPFTVTTVPNIVADRTPFINKRVKLENITFVNGFTGIANGPGAFSQSGKQISAISRPEGISIADGSQGDIYCYPSSTACYVFDANDFVPHEIISPFTSKTAYGVYSVNGDEITGKLVYTPGADQYSWTSGTEAKGFSLLNYKNEWAVAYSFPAKFKNGQELRLSTSAVGLPDFTSGNSQVVVEKIGTDKVWLMDYSAGLGYVFRISED